MANADHKYKYEAVTGYFLQDDAKTDPDTFEYARHSSLSTTQYSSLTSSQTRTNFGLIPRSYPGTSADSSKTQWQLFTTHLQHLIATAPSGTTYKLFYCARHGEGDHNVAEALYGTKAWDDYWSKLDGDGTRYWVDAHLTAVGEQQARDAGAFFAKQFKDEKMPVPDAWVASPLMRCLQTADLEWTGSGLKGVRPTIKEMAREVMGEHTCDRRSSRTKIHAAQPEWPIEEGFAEEDELWQADHREAHDEHDVRTLRLLEQVFANEGKDASVLSLTSHSGAIASLMRVIGHREFRLATGGMVPVLIKATKL